MNNLNRAAGITRLDFLKLSAVVGAGALAGAWLTGCGPEPSSASSAASAASAASVNEFDIKNWDTVLAASKGTEVNLYQYGGYAKMNTWLNTTVKSALASANDLKLNFTQVGNTLDIVTLIGSEIEAGITEGSVDFLWVNGENFYTLKNNGYLYGPILENLPNYKFLDPDNKNNSVDCGIPTEGYEVPYNTWFDVFWANSEKIATSEFPKDPATFLELLKKYPGQFTYPTPGDFTGTFCISTLIAGVIGNKEWEKVSTSLNLSKEQLREIVAPGLSYLRDLNPYLWQKGVTFPADSGTVDQMYADEELSLEFGCEMPQAKMNDGLFPKSTRPFILESGVIADVWYLAIPVNATNKAAALVALNEIMSPGLQLTQYQDLGYFPVNDMNRVSPEQKQAFEDVPLSDGMLRVEDMVPFSVAQASGANITLLEDLWMEEVVGKYNE